MLLTVLLALLGVGGVFTTRWSLSEGRMAYRRDRGELRRVRRRWAAIDGHLSDSDRRNRGSVIRQIEHRINLAGQAVKARRGTTSFVGYIRDPHLREPLRLDTPFERTYLIEVQVLLDRFAPSSPSVPTPAPSVRRSQDAPTDSV